MVGIQAQINLLLDHGHPYAWKYPLPMVFFESRLVVRRLDVRLASEMSLMQLAISTQPNDNVKPGATKKMFAAFRNTIKGMLDVE